MGLLIELCQSIYIDLGRCIQAMQHRIATRSNFILSHNIHSMKFLTTISHKIYYKAAQYILQPNADVYKKSVEEVINL